MVTDCDGLAVVFVVDAILPMALDPSVDVKSIPEYADNIPAA